MIKGTTMIVAHVVESTRHPGELSLRLIASDPTWTPFIRALKDAGFKPGDLVKIEKYVSGKGRRNGTRP